MSINMVQKTSPSPETPSQMGELARIFETTPARFRFDNGHVDNAVMTPDGFEEPDKEGQLVSFELVSFGVARVLWRVTEVAQAAEYLRVWVDMNNSISALVRLAEAASGTEGFVPVKTSRRFEVGFFTTKHRTLAYLHDPKRIPGTGAEKLRSGRDPLPTFADYEYLMVEALEKTLQ